MLSDRTIYKIHSWLGLVAAFFLLLISLTGIVLVYEDEIHELTGRDMALQNPAQGALPADMLVNSVRLAYPNAQLLSARLYANRPDMAVRFELKAGDESKMAYVDRSNAKIVALKPNEDKFFRTVLELHKELLLGFTGGLIMGLVGLCLLGSTLSGLWYYRKSLLQPFSTGVRFNKNRRIWNSDLHKLLGVSALLFLLLMSATGIFFHWEEIEHSFEGKEERKPEEASAAPAPKNYSVDQYLLAAQTQIPGFVPEIINFPKNADEPLRIRGNRPESQRLLGKFNSTVEYSVVTGQMTKMQHAEDADAEWKAEHIFEQLHFGRFGGWISKIIWALGGVSLALLTVTGVVIWQKRTRR